MKLTKTDIELSLLPEVFRDLFIGAAVYDSSSSEEAHVYYIDKDRGYFLKQAGQGTLAHEARMHAYFHEHGLASAMLGYVSAEKDWMLTEKTEGEDGIAAKYLEDPYRFCEIAAEAARIIHGIQAADLTGMTAEWIQTAEKSHAAGLYQPDKHIGNKTKEETYRILQEGKYLLRQDVLIHGDLCLPNILLKDWKLSGFVDFDHAGIGDRHLDLYWFTWSLRYNLHTDRYREYFLDAYGRQDVSEEVLQVIAAGESFV